MDAGCDKHAFAVFATRQHKTPILWDVLLQFSERWGPPPMSVASPGATLRARFSPVHKQAMPLMSAWGNLTHTLSGLFCSSLNMMVSYYLQQQHHTCSALEHCST